MKDDFKFVRRADRVTSNLLVETSRLCYTIEKMFIDGELTSQMATMIRDGSHEYGRALAVLKMVRTARSLEHARALAEDYLREI